MLFDSELASVTRGTEMPNSDIADRTYTCFEKCVEPFEFNIVWRYFYIFCVKSVVLGI